MSAIENIPIPQDTVNAVRSMLASQGAVDADVPGFVDQVLRREVLHGTIAKLKKQNADVASDVLQQEIDEAVDFARGRRS